MNNKPIITPLILFVAMTGLTLWFTDWWFTD